MILSDKTIKERVELGLIGCDPEPDPIQYQPASLDVRLGDEIYDVESGRQLNGNEQYLAPNRRYLANTKEVINLSRNLAAQLAGRSSVGRRGIIVHKTAGWIDPGFTGSITLEMMNFSTSPVEMREGDRVAQLVFFPLDAPSSGYDGKYQEQRGATTAKPDQ